MRREAGYWRSFIYLTLLSSAARHAPERQSHERLCDHVFSMMPTAPSKPAKMI
jgi:hypothetical protein